MDGCTCILGHVNKHANNFGFFGHAHSKLNYADIGRRLANDLRDLENVDMPNLAGCVLFYNLLTRQWKTVPHTDKIIAWPYGKATIKRFGDRVVPTLLSQLPIAHEHCFQLPLAHVNII